MLHVNGKIPWIWRVCEYKDEGEGRCLNNGWEIHV